MQDSNRFRRHPEGCRYYREDWTTTEVLYRSLCLLEMPPITAEEQVRCMTARAGCWRFRVEKASRRGAAAASR